jgi:hypothetical protein
MIGKRGFIRDRDWLPRDESSGAISKIDDLKTIIFIDYCFRLACGSFRRILVFDKAFSSRALLAVPLRFVATLRW